METDESIGERLRARREEIGLSVEELAAACGLSSARLIECEAGAAPLTVLELCRLADQLEAPLTYFHLPGFAHVGLPAGMDSGDLLLLFGRLSLSARDEVLALARRLDSPRWRRDGRA